MNSSIQFMHYRKFDHNVFNGVSVSMRGGATVAILPNDETGVATVAIAHCGPTDVFNKKVGRAISAGRINAYLNGRNTLESLIQLVAVPEPDLLKETVAYAVRDTINEYNLY